MTSTSEITEILKTDGRGRVRMPLERREALLNEFERSGLSGAKFAELCGVKYSSFAGWLQRRRRQRAGDGARSAHAEPAGGGVRWVEAVVGNGGHGGALAVHLPGGARMEITHRAQLALAAELLRALTLLPAAAAARPC